ncbi:MAG: MBL fold metallo-hydrolase [Chloroflexi bacterium]|nr:MBL fold metallo-hydrolase [Chloroflexota bacterium]
MARPIRAAADTYVLPGYFPIPGVGYLPINSFVILGKEPVLVDAGVGVFSDQFLADLKSIIDPEKLRWVWLTHDDSDHTGSIQKVLGLAPQARLVTHAFSAMRLSTVWPVPLDRVLAVRPGSELKLPDRTLHAVRPPLFDNPMSIGIFDDRNETLFSVDSFGALLPGEGEDAADFDEKDLTPGMVAWATFDSPWAHLVDSGKFGDALARVRNLNPKTILSSHLPPARNKTDQFLKVLNTVPASDPFVPPDQAAFEQLLKGITKPAFEAAPAASA